MPVIPQKPLLDEAHSKKLTESGKSLLARLQLVDRDDCWFHTFEEEVLGLGCEGYVVVTVDNIIELMKNKWADSPILQLWCMYASII